jgi:hypothetical protein
MLVLKGAGVLREKGRNVGAHTGRYMYKKAPKERQRCMVTNRKIGRQMKKNRESAGREGGREGKTKQRPKYIEKYGNPKDVKSKGR